MGRKKGTEKTGGRKKGTPNKTTTENRERVNKVISHLYENYLMDDLEEIGSSERVKTLIALMEYSLPKLQRVAHTGPNDEKLTVSFDLSTLTDDELNKLEGITAKLEGDKGGKGEA